MTVDNIPQGEPREIGVEQSLRSRQRRLFHGVNPRAYAPGFLSFDLPVRQAHGPEALEGEALEGEALDRWYGVKISFLGQSQPTQCW